MSSFTQPLILEALPTQSWGRGEFLVYEPFTYEIGHLGSGDKINIPKGYKTDLCSVPWFGRSFIPLSGKLAKPALIHDYMLDIGDKRANDVFEEAMTVAQVHPTLKKLIMVSVRIYGFLFWR